MVCLSCHSNNNYYDNNYYNNQNNNIIHIVQLNNKIDLLNLCNKCYEKETKIISSQNKECYEKIKLENIYINNLSDNLINFDLLIPDIFRKCQFDKDSCPSYLNSNRRYKYLPKLIDDNIIKWLLFNGVNTPRINYNNGSLNCKDLNKIINFIYPDFSISKKFNIKSFFLKYENTLLFKLLKFINISYIGYYYFISNKKLCNFLIDYPATIYCIDTDNCKTVNNFFKITTDNNFKLNYKSLYLIYKFTILNYNLNIIDRENNKLGYIFKLSINVLKDLIGVYSSEVFNKCYCNPSYNKLTDDIKEHICKYIISKKNPCTNDNKNKYSLICLNLIEIKPIINIPLNKEELKKVFIKPDINDYKKYWNIKYNFNNNNIYDDEIYTPYNNKYFTDWYNSNLEIANLSDINDSLFSISIKIIPPPGSDLDIITIFYDGTCLPSILKGSTLEIEFKNPPTFIYQYVFIAYSSLDADKHLNLIEDCISCNSLDNNINKSCDFFGYNWEKEILVNINNNYEFINNPSDLQNKTLKITNIQEDYCFKIFIFKRQKFIELLGITPSLYNSYNIESSNNADDILHTYWYLPLMSSFYNNNNKNFKDINCDLYLNNRYSDDNNNYMSYYDIYNNINNIFSDNIIKIDFKKINNYITNELTIINNTDNIFKSLIKNSPVPPIIYLTNIINTNIYNTFTFENIINTNINTNTNKENLQIINDTLQNSIYRSFTNNNNNIYFLKKNCYANYLGFSLNNIDMNNFINSIPQELPFNDKYYFFNYSSLLFNFPINNYIEYIKYIKSNSTDKQWTINLKENNIYSNTWYKSLSNYFSINNINKQDHLKYNNNIKPHYYLNYTNQSLKNLYNTIEINSIIKNIGYQDFLANENLISNNNKDNTLYNYGGPFNINNFDSENNITITPINQKSSLILYSLVANNNEDKLNNFVDNYNYIKSNVNLLINNNNDDYKINNIIYNNIIGISQINLLEEFPNLEDLNYNTIINKTVFEYENLKDIIIYLNIKKINDNNYIDGEYNLTIIYNSDNYNFNYDSINNKYIDNINNNEIIIDDNNNVKLIINNNIFIFYDIYKNKIFYEKKLNIFFLENLNFNLYLNTLLTYIKYETLIINKYTHNNYIDFELDSIDDKFKIRLYKINKISDLKFTYYQSISSTLVYDKNETNLIINIINNTNNNSKIKTISNINYIIYNTINYLETNNISIQLEILTEDDFFCSQNFNKTGIFDNINWYYIKIDDYYLCKNTNSQSGSIKELTLNLSNTTKSYGFCILKHSNRIIVINNNNFNINSLPKYLSPNIYDSINIFLNKYCNSDYQFYLEENNNKKIRTCKIVKDNYYNESPDGNNILFINNKEYIIKDDILEHNENIYKIENIEKEEIQITNNNYVFLTKEHCNPNQWFYYDEFGTLINSKLLGVESVEIKLDNLFYRPGDMLFTHNNIQINKENKNINIINFNANNSINNNNFEYNQKNHFEYKTFIELYNDYYDIYMKEDLERIDKLNTESNNEMNITNNKLNCYNVFEYFNYYTYMRCNTLANNNLDTYMNFTLWNIINYNFKFDEGEYKSSSFQFDENFDPTNIDSDYNPYVPGGILYYNKDLNIKSINTLRNTYNNINKDTVSPLHPLWFQSSFLNYNSYLYYINLYSYRNKYDTIFDNIFRYNSEDCITNIKISDNDNLYKSFGWYWVNNINNETNNDDTIYFGNNKISTTKKITLVPSIKIDFGKDILNRVNNIQSININKDLTGINIEDMYNIVNKDNKYIESPVNYFSNNQFNENYFNKYKDFYPDKPGIFIDIYDDDKINNFDNIYFNEDNSLIFNDKIYYKCEQKINNKEYQNGYFVYSYNSYPIIDTNNKINDNNLKKNIYMYPRRFINIYPIYELKKIEKLTIKINNYTDEFTISILTPKPSILEIEGDIEIINNNISITFNNSFYINSIIKINKDINIESGVNIFYKNYFVIDPLIYNNEDISINISN
jgi:hypothetical protein